MKRFENLQHFKRVQPIYVREIDPCDPDKTRYHRFRNWKQALRTIARYAGPHFSIKEAMYGLEYDGKVEMGDYEFHFDHSVPEIEDHTQEA